MRQLAGALAVAAVAAVAAIMGAPGAASAQSGSVSVELNKFEDIEDGCRAFFLFRNGTGSEFSAFELSLAILDTRGVIDRLLTIDAAPLPARRTTLKLFEIAGLGCSEIGEVLLHDIPACEAAGDAAADCFDLVDPSSLTDAPLSM